jgi:hypothetical protein
MSAFGFAVLSAVLTGGGVFLVVLTVLHEIARWKGRFVSVWLTFFAALLILPVLFGALIVGYAAFTQVDGSEILIPSVFWILIATGGALGGYIGVKVGVVRGSALDYRL